MVSVPSIWRPRSTTGSWRCCAASASTPPETIQDFEALNAGAVDRLRLPEWYDEPATEAQRTYIAKLMATRGLGSLTEADAAVLRKGPASEFGSFAGGGEILR